MIETDYLVVGAGASGMAFVDSLIAESDGDVVMVDRRQRPGGHWNDAYPFVRLHQPSAYYGVNSRVLGNDAIDEVGPNAGFYERATADEICDYYNRVLDEQLLGSGQVRFFGMCDYVGNRSGEHRFVSRLTGEETDVRVRRKFVDATYLEAAVPATHPPPFGVDADVRLIPVGELTKLTSSGTGYTIIGGGKTSMDACQWLSTTAFRQRRSGGSGHARPGFSTERSSSRWDSCLASSRECRSRVKQPRMQSTSPTSSTDSRRASNSSGSTRASHRRCIGAPR